MGRDYIVCLSVMAAGANRFSCCRTTGLFHEDDAVPVVFLQGWRLAF